jgi:hypothetical protein
LRGKEPAETHTFEYAPDGRIASVRVQKEPEWTPDQVSLILAVEAYEEMVGPHGQPMDEALSAESDPSNRSGKRIYRAGVPTRTPEGNLIYAPIMDWAEKARLDAIDAYKQQVGETGNTNGLVFPVQVIERRPGA